MFKKPQTTYGKAILFLVISILTELVFFNFRALSSMTTQERSAEFLWDGGGYYVYCADDAPGYLYLGIDSRVDGQAVPVSFTIMLQDEGNSNFYELSRVTLYPAIEKSKYLAVHSYGNIQGLRIVPDGDAADVQLEKVIFRAKVPFFFSLPRVLLLFGALCLGWYVRPSSTLYTKVWTKRQRRAAVLVLLLLQTGFLAVLAATNTAFRDPIWPYHAQYQKLAEALSRGEVSIDVGSADALAALQQMDNPYDSELRMETVPGAGSIWDICYYKGSFYVYFGIVPALVYYLPYYLLFGKPFPTWIGVWLSGSLTAAGVYFFLSKLFRRWFSDSPYALYLLFGAIVSNGLNLSCAMLHPDFYYLPIVMALGLTFWGLGFMLSAADHWAQPGKGVYAELAIGALCLALTAGCRPQFLVGSVLLLPLFAGQVGQDWRQSDRRRALIGRLTAVAVPYLLTAAGLMCYNAIRFGSVFDFGANYNLTTNDMTRRGLEWGRLPSGFYAYLFQPVNLQLRFPFAQITDLESTYLGKTISEWTFGGAFFTHVLLLGLLGILFVRKQLRQKGVYGFTCLCMASAVLVVAADTEMAGILNRYYTDFLWLLMIPTVIVLLQLLEKTRTRAVGSYILLFILIAGAWETLYELGIAVRCSEIIHMNAHRYYMLQSFFQ